MFKLNHPWAGQVPKTHHASARIPGLNFVKVIWMSVCVGRFKIGHMLLHATDKLH